MNIKLKEQLEKFFSDPQNLPQDLNAWKAFLQTIDETYNNYESNNASQDSMALLGQKVVEVEIEKARDEAIIESIGDGIIVTDAKARILVVNRGAEAILDTLASELKGRHIYEAYQIYDKEENLVPVENRPISITLSTGKRSEGFYYLRHKNGLMVAIRVVANPIVQTGRIIGTVEILQDVTEQEAIDRVKTEFISLASHQLRTPLSAIRWFSEMLLAGDAGKLTAEQEDYAQNIYDSSERMAELINSLLNIARVESGRITIIPMPTDLKAFVAEISKEFEQIIAKKQLQFTIEATDNLPKISIDQRLIRQVYSNLLSNAVKYTPKGGKVTVTLSQKGENVVSQVADTGYGIPKKQQANVFQKFFRGDNAVKIETVGTGLGLYLTKAVVEASGGRIWFLSEENKGTIFWFTLPISGTPAKKGDLSLD